MTTTHEPGPVTAGWGLLWQTQRVLWWIYAINLALGLLSGAGLAIRLSRVLDHSLAGEHLYHGFDLAYLIELLAHPDVQFAGRPMSAISFAAVFFVFMLFATGGILETYARTRILVPGEFLQGCGAFFWRFVRLLIWLLIVLVPILIVASLISRASGVLSSDSPSEKLGFWVDVVGLGVVVLALMIVRLWFDMAQVRAVVEDEHSMTRTLGRAFRLTFSNFGPLFWIYLQLSLVGWIGTVAALYVWIKFVPSERFGIAFLLGQFIAWLWIATRLWQRASEVIWYQRQRPLPEPVVVHLEEPSPEVATPEIADYTPPEKQLP